MPYVTRDKVNLYYEISGEGPPIIFTHGASWNHGQWEKQVHHFRNTRTVVTWDVRGHGLSSLPEGPVNSEDFSADLMALMDHLKLDTAVLCGLSMGGHISLQSAARYPERVTGLVLIGTPCTNSFNLYEKIVVPINRMSSRWISMETLAKMQAKVLSKLNPANEAYIREATLMIPHDAWIRLWDSVTRMESRDDLPRIACPTLLLIGDHDNLTNAHQEYMRAYIPGSELKVIPRAQHGTNLDNPEAVNREIEEFLAKKRL